MISYNLCFPRHTNLWKKWNYVTIISRTVSDFHPYLYLGHLTILKASSRCLQEAHGWSDRCLWTSHVSSQLCLPRSSPTLAPIRGTCCQSCCFPWRGLLVPDHCRSCRGNPPWGYCLLKLPTVKVSPALKAGSHCYGAMRPLLSQPSGLLIECYSWEWGSF